MVCDAGVEFTMMEAVRVIEAGVPGDLVECGTWRGGCGLAMLLAQRAVYGRIMRPVHFFDSFAGLPPVDPKKDGPAAVEWQANTEDNCRASRADLDAALRHFEFKSDDFAIHEGAFTNTLPGFTSPIALLRVDCDWYASVMQCLESLMPQVSKGATVIIDDYFAWDGCTRAVHDYLSGNDLPYRIRNIGNSGAYLVKS